jgi:tetratricopeptide (TPR) repeat protein
MLSVGMGRTATGAATLEQALSLQETLAREVPERAHQHQAAAALTRVALGRVAWQTDRFRQAYSYWQQGIDTLERLHRERPSDAGIHRQLTSSLMTAANSIGRFGLWEEVAQRLARFIELNPEEFGQRYRLAIYQRYLGDEAGFRKHCQTLLDQASSERVAVRSAQAVMLAMLSSEIFAKPEQLERLVEQSLEKVIPTVRANHRIVQGMLAYRTGNSKEAIARIEEGLKGLPDPTFRSRGYFFLALAEHKLGHAEAARAALTRGRYCLQEMFPQAEHGDFAGASQEWAAIQMHCREAEKQIEGRSFHPAAESVQRARLYFYLGDTKKVDKELDAAVADQRDNALAWLQRGLVQAELGRFDRALSDLSRAIELQPREPRYWIARGRFHLEHGRGKEADADFAKAAALCPEELNRFFEEGWWMAGPYPEALADACPPEKDTNPAHLPADDGSKGTPRKWRTLPTYAHGFVNLGMALEFAEHCSAYALAFVHAPRERSATLMVGGDDGIRVWLNGKLVHEIPSYRQAHPFSLERVPITLQAGRNTVLVKVNNSVRDHNFYLRLADDPLDRAFALAELTLWPEAATQAAREFARGAPFGSQAWHRYAALLVLTGDRDGNRRHCQAMLERFGRSADAAQAYSVAYACNLSPDEAIDRAAVLAQAERARKANPRRDAELFELAVARLRSGQAERTIRELESSAALKKKPQACAIMALAHHQLGHAAEAKTWLAQAEEAYGKDLDAALAATSLQLPYQGLAWEYVPLVIYLREAAQQITGAAPKADARLAALQKRARDWLKGRDPTMVDYDLATVLAPRSEHAWLVRAEHFAEKRDSARAAADFAQALSLVKDSTNPWHQDRAGIDDALVQHEEVLAGVSRLRPTDAQLWIARARFLARRRHWKAALEAAQKAVQLDPANVFSWYCLAALQLEVGDREGYQQTCRALLDRFGATDAAATADQIAKTCLLLPAPGEELQPAVRLAERAATGTEKDPNYPWFALARGLAELRMGHDSEAIPWLQRGLSADPQLVYCTASARLILALAYARQGQRQNAEESLEAARQLEARPSFSPDPLPAAWHDWLRYQILRREVEKTLPKLAPADETVS